MNVNDTTLSLPAGGTLVCVLLAEVFALEYWAEFHPSRYGCNLVLPKQSRAAQCRDDDESWIFGETRAELRWLDQIRLDRIFGVTFLIADHVFDNDLIKQPPKACFVITKQIFIK